MGRETSALFYLTSTTMKAFIVLSLAATALAVPGRSGRRQGGNKGAQKKGKMDPGNILRCAAENFGNNQTIKECLECFSAEMDFSSQGGLDAAKACASQFWPKGVAACGTEISAISRKHGSPGDCGRVLRRQAGEGERGEVLGGGDFHGAAGPDDRGHHVHP